VSALPATVDWNEANQRHLMAALGLVRVALRAHAAGDRGDRADWEARGELDEAAAAMPAPSALDSMGEAFGLSSFERDVLVMCAGMELEGSFGGECAAAQGDQRRAYPTFGLALASLPQAHWSAITSMAPLRRWHLVEISAGDTLTLSPLRIDERVLHFLTGVPHIDERLQGLVTPAHSHEGLPLSHRAVVTRIASVWSRASLGSAWPLIELWGDEGSGLVSIAAQACESLGFRAHLIRAADVPAAAAERSLLARLWDREAVLSGTALIVDFEDEGGEAAKTVLPVVDALRGVVLLICREPIRAGKRTTVRIQVEKPTTSEQRTLWRGALGSVSAELNGRIDAVVAQFNLGTRSILAASTEVLGKLTLDGEISPLSRDQGDTLWEACRAQARPRLDDLAQRIRPAATWQDLVLPDQQLAVLREIAAHVRHRTRVYETWGFAEKSARGLGISALFSGPSGTGKTMAAEVLANELRLDLYRIDLSQVVSKYIGETEKNLRRVFDAAEEGGSILLFDEADALFGKRSEVKDSHDRYANIEVSYLLQRMEAYRGLAILTTNLKNALDSAFLRRLRFVAQFPFPEASQRAEIWRRVFPASTPLDGLNPEKLARLGVAGGNIRNIAMNAAFLAADEGTPVGMHHLLKAARSEYGKLERPLTDAEVRGWI
jgi:ATP-dependent 26S proteasome regulatory subunit